MKLTSQNAWAKYRKSGKIPHDVPSRPELHYKNDGWKGFGDWLGTGSIATKNRVYLSFNEARDFARSLNLRGVEEWRQYSKSNKKPDDIPANPGIIYKNNGWKDWVDWLGNENRTYSEETRRKI